MFIPEAILIERGAEGTAIARRCVARAPGVPVTVVEAWRAAPDPPGGASDSSVTAVAAVHRARESLAAGGDDVVAAKRRLLLARRRGPFLEHCPAGTRGLACCNYLVVHFASNCPMDCGYCFLQDYLADNPTLTAYVNVEAALAELAALLDHHRDRRFRIGTGELADSLALDPLTGLSADLVPFFAARPNALLELKTKTAAVEGLLALDPKDRVVVSWSLAPPAAVAFAETGTATIVERLDAARRVVGAGYKVGVHLDPVIEHAGWEEGYRDLVTAIASAVPRERLAWVSMGALRLSARLRTVMRKRFPGTPLLAGEQVPGSDGKWREFQPSRVRMYRRIRAWVEEALPGVPAYLCMETPDVWEKVFATPPPREQALGAALAAR